MTEQEKLVDKLRKLKAHADSAEKIGSTEEAAAFAAMFQKLLMQHNLSMTDIEFEQHEVDEPVTTHRVNFVDVKERKVRIAWIERLALIIAKAYFCQALVHPRSSRISLVGRKTDAEIAEYMIVTLVRAAEQLARKERRIYRRAEKRRCAVCTRDKAEPHVDHLFVKSVPGEGFKAAFLKSFIQRLAERYNLERQQASSSSTALVRFNRAEAAVRDWVNKNTRNVSMVHGSRNDSNAAGLRRGRAAADAISLQANAVKAGTPQAQLR